METTLLTLILIVLLIIGRAEIKEFFGDIFYYLAKPGFWGWFGIVWVLVIVISIIFSK